MAAWLTVWFSFCLPPLCQAALMSVGLSVCLSVCVLRMKKVEISKATVWKLVYSWVHWLCSHGPSHCLGAWEQMAGVHVGAGGGGSAVRFFPSPRATADRTSFSQLCFRFLRGSRGWSWDHWRVIASFPLSLHPPSLRWERNCQSTPSG